MVSGETSHTDIYSNASTSSRHWKIAAALALGGAINPLPIPLSGIHKFYVGQPLWGGIYLLLGWTQIPRIACALEAVWYIIQSQRSLIGQSEAGTDTQTATFASQEMQSMATALRELEQLRQEGLVSELEFEQNRRSLLAKLDCPL